jgi:hypothetical protein
MELGPHDPAVEAAAPEGGREVDQTHQAYIQAVGVLNAGALRAQVDEAHRLLLESAVAEP